MKYNPRIHNRRSIRLEGYDYSQAGLYYITICVQNRECLFGKIVGTEMQLNNAGQMVHNEWLDIPSRFPQVQLHEFIVMPNHFHAIIEVTSTHVGASLVGAQKTTDVPKQGGAPTGETVGDMIGAFKSITTNEYIDGVKNNHWPRFNGKLWQRNFWEHIIRDEKSYQRIADYIINNPLKWAEDKFYRL